MADKKYDGGRPNIPADIDRSVRTQAGHRCSITFCNEHTYLEIHHIDENPLNDDITICDIGTIIITAHSIKNIYDIASAIFPPTVRGCLSERYKSFLLFLNILII